MKGIEKSWKKLKLPLISALCNAFNEAEFRRMLIGCGRNLDHLAARVIPYPEKVVEVVGHADLKRPFIIEGSCLTGCYE